MAGVVLTEEDEDGDEVEVEDEDEEDEVEDEDEDEEEEDDGGGNENIGGGSEGDIGSGDDEDGDEDSGGGGNEDIGDGDDEDIGGGGDEETRSRFVVELQKLNKLLGEAKVMPARGEGIELIHKLSQILPVVVERGTNDDNVAGVLSQETLSTYEYILMILSSPKELPVSLVASLLHPLCQLITDSNTRLRSSYIRHMKVSCGTKFKDQLSSMCSRILQYLNDMVPEVVPVSCLNNKSVRVVEDAFSVVVNDLHVVACWGLSYRGCTSELALVRDSLGKLQEDVWERLIASQTGTHYGALVCARIGEAMLAPTTNSGKAAMFSLQWLEEKDIVWKLLRKPYSMQSVPLVEQFLSALGAKGVVVKEEQFFEAVCERPPVPPVTVDHCNAADLIVARMLEVLDISSYSDKFLENALEWLEDCQADSELPGLRIFNILRKLLKMDKHKRWEKRVCTIFRKGATSVASRFLLDCLNEVADHYNTSHVPGSTSYMQMDDERAEVLQSCSNADNVICISTKMASSSRNQTKEYICKVDNWKEKEMDLDVHMNASAKLTKTLATAFSYTRCETAMKCLERAMLAQQLTVELNEFNSFASEIATAMLPELQAWEALKNESVVHSKVVQRVEEMSKKHVLEYDALKEKHYQELVKFAEACGKEKEDVVWDALYAKAKVLASVQRACVGKDEDLSSEDILKRLFLHVGGACKQMKAKLSKVEGKHAESEAKLSEVEGKYKESQPNVECAVCYKSFSRKRKRACLDPCGHASACMNCATQEWERTHKCFLCKSKIEKPIEVPLKLFF